MSLFPKKVEYPFKSSTRTFYKSCTVSEASSFHFAFYDECVIVESCISAGGPTDAETNHQSLLEGNMSTEACLTVLDVLSLFTQSFKVKL